MNEYEPYRSDNYEEYVEYTLGDFLEIYKLKGQEDVIPLLIEHGFRSIRSNKLHWVNLLPINKLSKIYNSPIYKVLELDLVTYYLDSIVSTYPKTIFNNEEYPLQPNDGEEAEHVFGSFMRKFENILLKTYDKYQNLILSYYKENEEMKDFLTPIKNTTISKSRYNELPNTSGGDPYDTRFTNNSNTAEVTSNMDGASLIARLEEIHRNCYNIYDEWCKEFAPIFKL